MHPELPGAIGNVSLNHSVEVGEALNHQHVEDDRCP